MTNLLNLLTFNVNGLNGPVKRKRILTYIKKMKIDIAFLQETHLTEIEHQKLRRDWVGKVIASTFNSKARGVAILVNKNLPIKIQKVVTDSVGRYVILHCQIFSELWTFLNIYAPNENDVKFIQEVFLNLAEAHDNILIGGDFNFCLDPILDRSSKSVTKLKVVKLTLSLMKDLNLIDIWRTINPRERDYSFYSNRHKTYSRIDFFLLSKNIQDRVKNIEYKARILSDHSPLLMTIVMTDKEESIYRWRFNLTLLKYQNFCDFMKDQIQFFLETNSHSIDDKFILWDAMKAYLRGQVISYTSKIKKEHMLEIDQLEKEITKLEKDSQRQLEEEKQKQLVNKKLQYNMLQTYQTEKTIIKTKQKYYELGERSHKILAWQLKTDQVSKTINAIRTKTNKITYKPLEINETLKNFYSELYQSESQNDNVDIERFLSQITLPKLNLEEQKELDTPFTLKEVEEAIGSFQNGKSPGEDGFPPEFYKKFKDLLIPPFMELLQQAERTCKLPESFSTAILIVLLKKDRDPLQSSSYRPISLLNTDYKIIAKILANRLSKYLPKLIHMDQTGFIKNRHSTDNISRLLSIMHLAQKRNEMGVAVALDAEKAFDRLEWDFLYNVLEKYGLGTLFINWIKILNSNPKAKVVTNGQISTPFYLTRSTRQGCPLSPALFVLAIEPLAELIRSDLDIKGFRVNEKEYKISLFADDILLYLTNPINSLPKLSLRLEEYGKISGYKINRDKSEILPLTKGDYTQCRSITKFRWPVNGIKYLGIIIDNNINNVYKLNYLHLLKKIQEDLDKWMLLPITLIGRVNAIKMNIFPRLQYLFQTLPLQIPRKFFQELNKCVRKFIWKGKMSRISLGKLACKFDNGGLQLPNFENYYKANQLGFIASFFDIDKPAWVNIELDKIGENSPEDFIYKWESKWICEKKESPILKHLIDLWNKVNINNEGKKALLVNSPLFQNRLIPFTMENQFLYSWVQKGIRNIGDCFEGNKLMSFDQLKNKYKISNNTFFCYFQLKAYLREKLGQTMLLPEPNEIEILIRKGKIKKFTSCMYNLIQGQTITKGIHSSRQKWENDLNIKIDEKNGQDYVWIV